MSSPDLLAEGFAKLLYDFHEETAPGSSRAPQVQSGSWQGLSANERAWLVAAVRSRLLELAFPRHDSPTDHDRYFARPGEAEWGC